MFLFTVSFLILSALSASRAFVNAPCSNEAITKARQPLIINPPNTATVVCHGFDLTRDDADQRLAEALITGAPNLADSRQCAALLDAAVAAAVVCVRDALSGSSGASLLSASAQSAAIDIATALGCSKFKAFDAGKFVLALQAGDTAAAAASIARDDFCLTDSCRCAQNRYCVDPCVSTTFDATCPIAPGSEVCKTVAAAPFACQYSTWSKKMSCSARCSGGKAVAGVEVYGRTVNDASQCNGALSEERPCTTRCNAVAAGNNDPYAGPPVAGNPNVVANPNNVNNVVGNGAAAPLDNNTIGAIVGGSLGGLALVGLLVFLVRRRSNKNTKDSGSVYDPSHQVPAVANPLFSGAEQSRDNPLFSEDSLQKISVAPVPAPIVAAAPAAAASPSRDSDETAPIKRKKSSKKKIRADSAAELAVCLTCGKEFKDAGLLRLHATSHAAGGDDGNGGNETVDADTFATHAIKRRDSVLDDKPALAISSQGSVANLMDASDL